MSTYITNLQN